VTELVGGGEGETGAGKERDRQKEEEGERLLRKERQKEEEALTEEGFMEKGEGEGKEGKRNRAHTISISLKQTTLLAGRSTTERGRSTKRRTTKIGAAEGGSTEG
jgi:hypothetical protein